MTDTTITESVKFSPSQPFGEVPKSKIFVRPLESAFNFFFSPKTAPKTLPFVNLYKSLYALYAKYPPIIIKINKIIAKIRTKIRRRLNCSKERASLPFFSRFKFFFSSFRRSFRCFFEAIRSFRSFSWTSSISKFCKADSISSFKFSSRFLAFFECSISAIPG